MDMKVQEFLSSEVGKITKFLVHQGWEIQKIIEDLKSEDSCQIKALGMYQCMYYSQNEKELKDFIHNSQWGQKIKREVKFLTLNYLKIERALNTNNVQLGV